MTDETLARTAARVRAWKRRNPDKVREQRAKERKRKGAVSMAERRRAAQTRRAVARMDGAVLKDIRKHLHVGTWREHGLSDAERWRRRYRQDEAFRRSELEKTAASKKIKGRYDGIIRDALRRGGHSDVIVRDLGYSVDEFRMWFESRFRPGMSWDAFFRGDVEMDHITPLSKFDLTNPDERRKAWALHNIQPLWQAENKAKHKKDGWEDPRWRVRVA